VGEATDVVQTAGTFDAESAVDAGGLTEPRSWLHGSDRKS
jgi:hypothetical protein